MVALPPDGAVQLSLICDVEIVVEVGFVGAPGTVIIPDPFTSTATSSHISPLLAVHLQVTKPGDGTIVELDAPVIAFGTLRSHCCVHVGEPRVEPPYIDGKSKTKSFGYFVVIDIVGLLGVVLWRMAFVGIGLVWFTPEKEYAPTTACVGPAIVTTISPVPLGFFRYQNSASLL